MTCFELTLLKSSCNKSPVLLWSITFGAWFTFFELTCLKSLESVFFCWFKILLFRTYFLLLFSKSSIRSWFASKQTRFKTNEFFFDFNFDWTLFDGSINESSSSIFFLVGFIGLTLFWSIDDDDDDDVEDLLDSIKKCIMNKTQITNRVQDKPISTADSIGKASITILLTYMETQKKKWF